MRKLIAFAFVALTAFACRDEIPQPISSPTLNIEAKLPGTRWLIYDRIQPNGNRARRWHEFSRENYEVRGEVLYQNTDSILVDACVSREILRWGDNSLEAGHGEECRSRDAAGKPVTIKIHFLSSDSINFTTIGADGAAATEAGTRL